MGVRYAVSGTNHVGSGPTPLEVRSGLNISRSGKSNCPASTAGAGAGHERGASVMTPAGSAQIATLLPLSRRTLVGSSLATAAVWRVGAAPALGAWQEASSDPTTWRLWLLDAVDELSPAAPGDPTPTEIDELRGYESRRNDETAAMVTRWGSGPAVIPWVQVGLDLADEFGLSGPRDSRAQALLRTALYDTVLAALDAQAAYPRAAPTVATPQAGAA